MGWSATPCQALLAAVPGASVAMVAALVLSSCGDGGTEPDAPSQTAAALEKIAGDEQVALRGEVAPAPLRVRVVGADGAGLPGVRVQWSVIAGQATLDPPEVSTDGSGVAETRVTIGATTGTVSVRAVAQGISPVTFALEALDPCQFGSEPEFPIDRTVTGRLQPLDCNNLGDGRLHDFYRLTVATQRALIIRLASPSFDPLVRFFDSPERPRELGGAYDTSNVTREALMRWILAPGTYIVAATTYDTETTGSYELSIGLTSESATLCRLKWIVPGITTAQTLESTDCVEYPGPFHEDRFVLYLGGGDRITLTHSSTQFAPRLRLFRRSGELVAEANGSTSGTATITFTSDQTSLYFVRPSSALPQQTGAYTLRVALPPP